MNERKRFTAWVIIPALRGDFEICKHTDDGQEAIEWLARQVARHPNAERYAVDDNVYDTFLHESGLLKRPPARAEVEQMVASDER